MLQEVERILEGLPSSERLLQLQVQVVLKPVAEEVEALGLNKEVSLQRAFHFLALV